MKKLDKYRNSSQSKGKYRKVTTQIHDRHLNHIEELVRSKPGITKMSVLFAALEELFSPSVPVDVSEEIRKELKTVRAKLERQEFLSRALLDLVVVFIKVWMCHTPEVPEAERPAAVASMQARFPQVFDLLQDSLYGEEDWLARFIGENQNGRAGEKVVT